MVPILGPSGAGLFAICCTSCLSPNWAQSVVCCKYQELSHQHFPPTASLEPLQSGCQEDLKARGYFPVERKTRALNGNRLFFSLLLFIPNHFESFRRKERKTCLTEPRKVIELSDCPCLSCAGQSGLLMIHGRRTIVLLAASHVINQRHRELAAISRSGVCRSQSYLTWPHWFPVKSLYGTGHPKWRPQSTGCSGSDHNGSALLEKAV